ncbi:MAG: ribonuclease P protein component [Candidatus Paceibacterota bacterium]|jgi:ribonuclease P protein component
MLPKKNRADKKVIEKIFKEGRFISSSSFTFKFILNKSSNKTRISFIAPKNIAKLAVKRNFLRRKGYVVLKKYINRFPLGILGVFIFRKPEEDISKIENEIKNILNKIN